MAKSASGAVHFESMGTLSQKRGVAASGRGGMKSWWRVGDEVEWGFRGDGDEAARSIGGRFPLSCAACQVESPHFRVAL